MFLLIYLNNKKIRLYAISMKQLFDIFVIGGGINGAGIARDAAGRGLKVFLAEKNKFGSATSSWSTKLIHGGLRYLENYEFKLVREYWGSKKIKFKNNSFDGSKYNWIRNR